MKSNKNKGVVKKIDSLTSQSNNTGPNHVTGILLLMLEDDSMKVRLAGIKAISHFAKHVKDIRK